MREGRRVGGGRGVGRKWAGEGKGKGRGSGKDEVEEGGAESESRMWRED